MDTATEIERKRLEALPEGPARTYALTDLAMTPGARFVGAFMGETFYGVTAEEVALKIEEFARDAGPDFQTHLAIGDGIVATALPTEA